MIKKLVQQALEQKARALTNRPIHEFENKWYFWDENWLDRIGPYESEYDADKALKNYADEL